MKIRIALAAATLLFAQAAPAALLGSFGDTIAGSSGGVPTETSVVVGLCLVASGSCSPQLSFVATTADAGTLHTFDAMTDAAFPLVESFLTNGNGDRIQIGFELTGGGFVSSRLESVAFAGSSSTNGIDFAGFDITSIEIALGEDFRVGGPVGSLLTEVYGAWSVRVYGTPVPEPAGFALVGLGLAALAARADRLSRCATRPRARGTAGRAPIRS